ncbi:VacJ family lipoprotein [Elioraea sp. Yellowstone]|jgi:phospholipid-binding lipoprotein MlaA|uniref:MlaA family lipoprotein n=1 Tax=Elioraea sp. Yellowstone TaxID=2592070 RepID=UPI00138723E4|nr:VacJ family lipoprotein [Elioraea sp. Yellowstone]
MRLHLLRLAALLAAGLAAGCALPPPESEPEARSEYFERNDPLEPLNRVTHTFNEAVDVMLLRPVAEMYRLFIPQPLRTGIGNAIDNLLLPRTAAYQLLQGKPDKAAEAVGRFAVNSTVGILGIFDFASDLGLEPQFEDAGQTLGVWAGTTNGGPYIVLPLLGPSNVRDVAGRAVDFFTDPWGYLGQGDTVEALRVSRVALQTVDTREQLIEPIDALRESSLDYYAAVRSVYHQQRAREILDQTEPRRRRFDWSGQPPR